VSAGQQVDPPGAPAGPRRAAAAARLVFTAGGLAVAAALAVGVAYAVGGRNGAPLAAAVAARLSGASGPSAARIRRGAAEIEFPATIESFRFNHDLFMPGYHAVVWRGGRAAGMSLLRAEVTDVEVLEALEQLGARPGNALGMETWNRRHDPHDPAPDQVIAGPPVEVLVRLPGAPQPLPLGELLSDPGGRGVEMRFGGHRANIPLWHSGCIVCLYSCPGSKVGNARYTVRDYVRGTTRFRARGDRLPRDGTEVGVILRLAGPPARGG
jgi:hypothetical protein